MPRPTHRPPTRNPRGLGANQASAQHAEVSPQREQNTPRPQGSSRRGRPRRPQAEDSSESGGNSPRPRASSERGASQTPRASTRRSQSAPRGVLNEIRQLQASTALLIPKLPFARVIREVLQGLSRHDLRITGTCLEALQEASEIYLAQLFEDANLCTQHRQKATLTVKDMQLTLALRRPC